jgi:hypothetical protein
MNFPVKNITIKKDSFVTHRKMMENQKYIIENGVEKYIDDQKIRIKILKKTPREYNDGRNKSYLCIAARLLDTRDLNEELTKAENQIKMKNILEDDFKSKSKILKIILTEYAKNQQPRPKGTGYVGSDRYGLYAGSNTLEPKADAAIETALKGGVLDSPANKNIELEIIK